jgi:hypothetical protein
MKRVGASVPAGFPSLADDYMQGVLDFNEHLVKGGHKDATFVLRVSAEACTALASTTRTSSLSITRSRLRMVMSSSW